MLRPGQLLAMFDLLQIGVAQGVRHRATNVFADLRRHVIASPALPTRRRSGEELAQFLAAAPR